MPAQFAAEPSLAQAESGRPAHKTPEAPAGIQDAAPPSERPAPIDWPFPAGLWPWISGGVVVVWLLTLGLWLRERRASRQRGEPKGGKPPGSAQGTSLSHLRSGIKRACAAATAGLPSRGISLAKDVATANGSGSAKAPFPLASYGRRTRGLV